MNDTLQVAFITSARNGDIAGMRAALDLGAELDKSDDMHGSALFAACRARSMRSVRFLLEHGAKLHDVDEQFVGFAEWPDFAEVLLGLGANVDYITSQGWTALGKAAWNDDYQVASWLLRRGANVELRCRNGKTPLHLAAIRCNVHVLSHLLRSGASPQARTVGKQSSSLHLAASNSEPELSRAQARAIALLCKRVENIDIRDVRGATALHIAASFGSYSAIRVLLRNGADPNAKDRLANTPLIIAATRGHKRAVRALLLCGAGVEIRNRWRQTALMRATHDIATMRELLRHGAKRDARDREGRTAGDYARKYGSPLAAEVLATAQE